MGKVRSFRRIAGLILITTMLVSGLLKIGPFSHTSAFPQAFSLFRQALDGKLSTTPTAATGWVPIQGSKSGLITRQCTPIRVVVNTTLAPTGALEDVKRALANLTAATGVTWEFAGTTTEAPSLSRLPSDPILIAWEHGGAVDSNGNLLVAVGEAGRSGPIRSADGLHWSSGISILNIDQDSNYTPGFGIGRTRGALLLHELGHVAGLGHIEDPASIMTPYSQVLSHTPAYDPGSLQGLRAIFAGCQK